MAIGAYFANESFDKKKYEETLKRLEAAGQGAPKGGSITPASAREIT